MTTIPIAKLDDVSGGKTLIERWRYLALPDQSGRHEPIADLARESVNALTAASERIRVLEAAADPETLEAIADEIDCFKHSARAAGLRSLAKAQRAALHAEPDRSGG